MTEQFSTKFIVATEEMSTLYCQVSSPYLRKTLTVTKEIKRATLTV